MASAPPLDPGGGGFGQSVEQLPELRPVQPTAAPIVDPSSLSDVFHASDVLARQDNPSADEVRLRDGYAPIVSALGLSESENPARFYDLDEQAQARFGTLGQPSDLATAARQGETVLGSTYLATRSLQERLIVDQIKLHRQKDPNFLKGVPDTVEGLHDYFLAAEKTKRAGAQATLANAPGGISSLGAQLGGGIYGGFHDPLNIASLAIPGGPGKTLLQIAARDALINGAIELVEQPMVAQNRADLGEHLTLGEAATNVATAAAGGAVLGGAIHVGGKAIAATGIPTKIGEIVRAMPEQARAYWGPKIGSGVQAAKDFASSLSNSDLVRFSRDAAAGKLTPDETAAANVLERSQEVGETSPYQPGAIGDGTHESGLAGALKDLEDGRAPGNDGMTIGSYVDAYIRGEGRSDPAMEQFAANNASAIEAEFQRRAQAAGVERPPEALSTSRRPQPVGDAAIESFKAKVGGAENATGNVNARNPHSSASGPSQITDPTFRSYYKRLTGTDPGAHPAEAIKNDPATQNRILDVMTRDNANALGALGETVNDGNLYVMHVFGPGDGGKLFKAAPDAPIERVLSAAVLDANPFLKGKSASQAIAWAHEKMGRAASSVGARPGFASNLDPASEDPAIAQLRAEALQLDNAVIGATRLPDGTAVDLHALRVPASSILIDAERFQFKSGGDAQGVTDRLHGVEEWDPGRAGRVTLWEDNEGRLFAADGHQRLGLAKRVGAAHGVDIPIDAMVLRERDGITAEDVRTWAALKNIAEGTGTTIDAAKVARSAGLEALHGLPPKSALVRDAGALARLSDEAFGAVYNGVIPPDYAAVIGHLLPDRPDAHAAMVDLLTKLGPANRGQAESIVRQGMAAGLHVEHQDELFGSRELVSSLMLERAKVLEKGLAKIRRLGLVHKTAATEKATLEAVGSTIAAERSAKEAQANVEAAQIVSRLAFSRGPVADALNAAAEKLAKGARLSDVVDAFAADVRKLDLAAVSRAAPVDNGGGGNLDGSGRGGDTGEAGAAVSAQPGDPGEPQLDEPTLGDLLAATERFSDPDGKAVHQQADSLEHDLKAELGDRPNVAEGRTVFRGEHGGGHNGEIQTRLGSISFSEDRGVAEIYAKQPNDRVKDPAAIDPRVIQAALDIRKPVMNDPEDPFIGLDVIEEALGRDMAVAAAHDFATLIENTSNWREDINPDGQFADLADYIKRQRNPWPTLYFDAHVLFDDPKWVARFKAAGFDGAIHAGMGESALTTEFKVFDKSQIKRLEEAAPSLDLPAQARAIAADLKVGEPGIGKGWSWGVHSLLGNDVPKGGMVLDMTTPEGNREFVFDKHGELVAGPLGAARDRASLDNGAAVDPAIAERQRQELALRAGSPLRPGAIDAKSEIGLPLMDVADQFGFRLEEEGGTVKPQDLLDELDADAKAIQAMKDCL